jgi:hypothetical protein
MKNMLIGRIDYLKFKDGEMVHDTWAMDRVAWIIKLLVWIIKLLFAEIH